MPIIAGIAVIGLSLISGAFLVRYLTVHPLQMSSSLLVTSLAAVLAVGGGWSAAQFSGRGLVGSRCVGGASLHGELLDHHQARPVT